MDTRWVATVALSLSLLCCCRSSGQPEYQASQRQFSTAAKDPSEQIKEISTSQLKALLEVEAIAAEVRSFLHEEWGITHATLEAEANGCGREELLGDWK